MSCTRTVWAPQVIEAYFITKADGYGFPGYQKRISRLGVLIPANEGTPASGTPPLQLSILFDEDVYGSSRSVSIANDERWKMYRMDQHNTGGRSGSVLQVRVGYVGVAPIDVEQLQITFDVIGRRARFR